MPDILHQIATKSALKPAFDAITTIDGLRGWWTVDTTGESKIGGTIAFRFPLGGFDMKVLELDRARGRVLWRVIDGPEEWIGTTISFDMRQEEDFAVVNFRHMGWKEPVEFMHHCSTKWATFLMSLKAFVETGKGAPSPDDVKVCHWN